MTKEKKSNFNGWLGWGISTLLLLFLQRSSNSGNDSESEPDKYRDDNLQQIGSPVPAVLGRVLLTDPLVSFYGAWRADIYTEEYGMHTGLDAASIIWPILLSIIMILLMPEQHFVVTNTGTGEAFDAEGGAKDQTIVMAVLNALIMLLLQLFANHEGRTTIQKGFKYFLGWQHILCWTGDNVGLKRLWMNVYDSELEASAEQAVWDNGIAWKKDNLTGMSFYIDQPDMFGGYDEQGGFVGQFRCYFGDDSQPKDSWMIYEMLNNSTIPSDLKGLTPKYPMYFTCVISDKDKQTGAYIGMQSTIPEMWFEVVNYPDRLSKNAKNYRVNNLIKRVKEYHKKLTDYYNSQTTQVQNSVLIEWGLYNTAEQDVEGSISDSDAVRNQKIVDLVNAINDLYTAWPPTGQIDLKDYTEKYIECLNQGIPTLGRLGDDLNPAEAIYEILKNELWGCQYTDDRIDIESLVDLGCTCEREGLGVSLCLNTTQECNNYINKILEHINGVKFDDPTTGKLTFKLIRKDYDVDSLKVFDVTNTATCEYSRLDWSETISSVSVNYLYADEKYTSSSYLQNDVANRYITGYYTEKQIDGTYYTTTDNAKWLASISLISLGYPLSAVNLTTNRYAYDLKIGDVFKLNWGPYGLEQMIYRVTDLDYANIQTGAIQVTAVEDVFAFEEVAYAYSSDIGWDIPVPEPDTIRDYLYLEVPYEYISTLDTFVYAYANQPSSDTIRWNIWRNRNGSYSISNSSIVFSPMGLMTYGIALGFDTAVSGIEISALGLNSADQLAAKSAKIAANPTMYHNKSKLNLLLIEDEILSYDDIVLLANGHYQLTNVIRGVFDTLPQVHSAQTPVIFMEYNLNINANNTRVCKEGEISYESLGVTGDSNAVNGTFDVSMVEDVTTTRRTERPSVMANLKIDADRGDYSNFVYLHQSGLLFSGNFKFVFIPRNKFTSQQILEQADSSLNFVPETTTHYYVTISYDNDVKETRYFDALDSSRNALDNFVLKWHDYCNIMGSFLAYYQTVKIEVGSYNTQKELDSHAHYEGQRTVYIPQLVGIVETVADAQALANSYADYFSQDVIIPASNVAPNLTYTFTQCPLIFIGTKTGNSYDYFNQVGDRYSISTEAYRIDGCDVNNVATLTKIDVEDGFVWRSNFTQVIGNYEYYRKYNGTTQDWDIFVPYRI